MKISELWIEHTQSRFPKGYGGQDINGVCVVLTYSDAAGCISSYVKHENMRIDIKRYQVLERCKLELEKILPHIEDEAFDYFSRLHEMCSIVLSEAEIA